jgi:hypothetical protein
MRSLARSPMGYLDVMMMMMMMKNETSQTPSSRDKKEKSNLKSINAV